VSAMSKSREKVNAKTREKIKLGKSALSDWEKTRAVVTHCMELVAPAGTERVCFKTATQAKKARASAEKRIKDQRRYIKSVLAKLAKRIKRGRR